MSLPAEIIRIGSLIDQNAAALRDWLPSLPQREYRAFAKALLRLSDSSPSTVRARLSGLSDAQLYNLAQLALLRWDELLMAALSDMARDEAQASAAQAGHDQL